MQTAAKAASKKTAVRIILSIGKRVDLTFSIGMIIEYVATTLYTKVYWFDRLAQVLVKMEFY